MKHNLTQQTIGRLRVLKRAGCDKHGNPLWFCVCVCGQSILTPTSSLIKTPGTRSCGCFRRELTAARGRTLQGSTHPQWKGGRKKSGGYIRVWCPDHPNADKRGYVAEHILVMSRHLQRPLLPKETVHHRNGVRDDNRLANLELWSSSHPTGQRVEDKIAWATSILNLYAPELLEKHGYARGHG